MAKLGIIGGSGVYQIGEVAKLVEHPLTTPFGDPSDKIAELTLHDGSQFFFLPRHGKGHRFLPSEVNYRANIHALKQLGVTHLLAISAVGIMQEAIRPGEMVIPDQIFDRTKGVRPSTFFGEGIVGHVTFADPFCKTFSNFLGDVSDTTGAKVHRGGTYVCMEGPQFSTRAESRAYRQMLAPSVIGMTALPEAKLAREAELCYAMLALATDYDCWNEKEEDVSVDAIMAVLRANSALASTIARQCAKEFAGFAAPCACHSAAAPAIMTSPALIPNHTKDRLEVLYGKYLGNRH